MRRLLLLGIALLAPLTSLALTFEPDAIRRCPRCANLFREWRIASGNPAGAVLWTDGKLEAPLLPYKPCLVRCRKCHGSIWVADAELVSEDGRRSGKPEWEGVERPENASEADFLSAAAATKDQAKELYLRTRAWWLRNDSVRSGESGGLKWTMEQKQNLERLRVLLDAKDPDQQDSRAEIERELGNFEASLKILEGSFPERYRTSVSFLSGLALEKKAAVARMP